MRNLFFIPLIILAFSIIHIFPTETRLIHAETKKDTQSIIIEVEGDPKQHKSYLETYYPLIDIVATYDKLFNGLALQAAPDKLAKMESLDFIKAVHHVQTYQTQARYPDLEQIEPGPNTVLPHALNDTDYTGKGVKVGVVDTGIDYNHPDLKVNYKGGYDLVELDDDPMETTIDEGEPTLHGTHVAGIIAASGNIKGVAPDAEIYAYRALGPGGRGTSIQVIAALEQAVEDGVDVINLSLGNSVNGPDYPTSIAVNRAVDHGVAVVIANGNAGPSDWTVGSPATATKAISVGALTKPQQLPVLYEPISDKTIALQMLAGSPEWTLRNTFQIVAKSGRTTNMQGKIALVKRGEIPFYETAKKAQDAGAVAVVIFNNEDGMFQGSVANQKNRITIPVAAISKQAGKWLHGQLQSQKLIMETQFKETKEQIADFSSRGPVTVNWHIKPDVTAPGSNILSTVPGGYAKLRGTSMAAPHVTGAIALLKEAHPDWSVQQIKGALQTTAMPLKNQDKFIEAIIQGMGQIRPGKAINAKTIIYNPLLSFGKMESYKTEKKIELTLENKSAKTQTYSFSIPKQQKGLSWNLPMSFTLQKNETKTLPIRLSVVSSLLQKGIHQGFLTLEQDSKTYHLPYLFVNETADYPKAMGFDFALKPFSDDTYRYDLYLTDPVQSLTVALYNPDTLVYDRTLLTSDNMAAGMNEGYIEKTEAGASGSYNALITIQLENGEFETYESEVEIPE